MADGEWAREVVASRVVVVSVDWSHGHGHSDGAGGVVVVVRHSVPTVARVGLR